MLEPPAPAAEHVEEDVARGTAGSPRTAGSRGPSSPGCGPRARRPTSPTSPASTRRCRLPSTVELVDRQVAGDDRRIDQRVVVRGAIVVRAGRRGPRASRSPTAGTPGGSSSRTSWGTRRRSGSANVDERGRAVQDDQVRRHPVHRDRPSIAGEPVGHDDLRAPPLSEIRHRFFRVDSTSSAVPSGRPGREALDLPGVVLDAVEARRPDGHHQLDRRAAARRDRGLDLGDVLLRRREADRVDDRLVRSRPGAEGDPARQRKR